MNYNELQHSGVKGMKWGQRLYQHKDGSLTPLGRVRYGTSKDFRVKVKRQQALKKARDAKIAQKKAEEKAKIEAEKRAKDVAAGKISAKKMTDQELQYRLQRVNAEKQYQDAMLATHTGKRIASKLLNEAVVPGLIDAGKHLVGSSLKKYGGMALKLDDGDNAHDKLKKQWEESKWRKEILSNNKQSKHLRKEAEEEKLKEKQEKADKKNKQKNDSSDDNKQEKTEKKETWEGTVEGEGTSKGSQTGNSTKSKPSDYYDPIDSVGKWVNDTQVSNLPAVVTSQGRSQVSGYLDNYGGWLLEDLNGR